MLDFRPKVTVTLQPTAEHYACAIGESLLRGMMRLGRKGIPVGCVNGGCGVCKVRVVDGDVERLGPISRAHVSEAEEAGGFTLACRVRPTSAVTVEVAGTLARCLRKGLAPAQPEGTVSPTPR